MENQIDGKKSLVCATHASCVCCDSFCCKSGGKQNNSTKINKKTK